jgi:hypothetical protein
VLDVADNPDDLSGQVLVFHQDHQPLADRAVIRVHLPRHRLVDHESERRPRIVVFFTEGPALA